MKFSKKLYFSLDFKVFNNVSFSSSLQTPGYFRKKMVKTFNIKAFILSKPFNSWSSYFRLSYPDPRRWEKINSNFFVVPQKVLWRSFEAPQRSLKIKFYFDFHFNQLSDMHGAEGLIYGATFHSLFRYHYSEATAV